MKCENCGYDAPERAIICPECGEPMPRQKNEEQHQSSEILDNFSMPYLQAPAADSGTNGGAIDPKETAQAKEIKHNLHKRWIIYGSILAVIAVLVIIYGIFFSGYKWAVFRYVKGADYSSGSLYLSLVPDEFVDYLETTYSTTRRDVKNMVSDYWVYWNENEGMEGSMSYDIQKHYSLGDTSIAELEEELMTNYNVDVDISKAESVTLVIDDGGLKSTEEATFFKVGLRWYCLEALDGIDEICEYDGYDVW
ncbi:MAG: hypothetical protein LUF89_03530 [Ruminococcus sp.]|nr:hypothetical protein [Ruminococcus sp.]